MPLFPQTRSGASKDYKNTRSREDVRDALAAFVGDNTTALVGHRVGWLVGALSPVNLGHRVS